MKKTRLIIIIVFALLLTTGIAFLGNYLINRRAELNLSSVGAIDELLSDISSEDLYMGDEFSNVTDNLENTIVINEKQDALDAVDNLIDDASATPTDETGGFNVDFQDL